MIDFINTHREWLIPALTMIAAGVLVQTIRQAVKATAGYKGE